MKKIFATLITILLAVLVIHSIVFLMPGDPAQVIAGEYASPEDLRVIRKELALDQGLLIRYLYYIKKLCVMDLGTSIYTGKPVRTLIIEKFPATLLLASFSIAIAVLLGVGAGIIAAVFQHKWPDTLILWLSSFTISTPVFVTCVLLSFVFSYILGLLPPSGKDGYNLSYLILPALALASRSLALIVRVVRNELLGVMSSQYIIMATSLGFHPVKILCIFALKNILVPVLTVVLLDFGAYLGGAVVTESVYAWPGVGRLLITAMLKRDFPVIQGVILLGTLLFILIGVCIDFIQDTVVKREA